MSAKLSNLSIMDTSLSYAQHLDAEDPLQSYRSQFHFPKDDQGNDLIYLCGNSLGLQPQSAHKAISDEMDRWANHAVEGHFDPESGWIDMHQRIVPLMAPIVGGKDSEVTLMNTLTVNLHLMMVSFYRPTSKKHKILIDYSAFPSDRYAVDSQVRFHGFDPSTSVIELQPSNGSLVSDEDIIATLASHHEEIALVLLGGVNYFSGQFYNIPLISAEVKKYNIPLGLDLAHAVGNVPLNLHEDGVDFAVWCTYKYLNGGPGSIGGAFVHERHHDNKLPRFEGWWGQDRKRRFLLEKQFHPMAGAEAWQLSCQPILSLVPLSASLHIHALAGMEAIRAKSILLSSYLVDLLTNIDTHKISIVTPLEAERRGAQISVAIEGGDKSIFHSMREKGVLPDWREPNIIRLSPAPLYNSFQDVWRTVEVLKGILL